MALKQTNIIGVLGGMGPLATQVFFGEVISNTDAKRDQEHVNMLIINHATIPDRTEALLSGDTEPLFNELLEDCVFLERSGVSHIVIPCNTSHFFIKRLRMNLKVSIINMAREAVLEVKSKKSSNTRIGILATDGTIEMKLYQKELESEGLNPYVPSGENQKRVMKIIYDGVKGGGKIEFADFKLIEEELIANGCGQVILGCTELSCFAKENNLPPDYYIDAMRVLARKTITAAGGKLKNSMERDVNL